MASSSAAFASNFASRSVFLAPSKCLSPSKLRQRASRRVRVATSKSAVAIAAPQADRTRISERDLHLHDILHVVEAQQFTPESLHDLFIVAREMEKISPKNPSKILDGYVMATLFYEPSTRTRLSFESAMTRLGGHVLTTENAREFSSAAKGETLEDSIRTVQAYSDVIVLRHFESGAAYRAALVADIPIISAGDGPGQHPTQALLDLYTIQKEVGRLDNIKIGLVGDLANGRTARSLIYLLAKFPKPTFYFVAPDVVAMKIPYSPRLYDASGHSTPGAARPQDDIKEYLTELGHPFYEVQNLAEVASEVDVIYQTRIQKERFGDKPWDYEKARGKFIVDNGILACMRRDAIVMHPLPRVDEIKVEVDTDPRAAYFRQAQNGLFIRMALLKSLLLK